MLGWVTEQLTDEMAVSRSARRWERTWLSLTTSLLSPTNIYTLRSNCSNSNTRRHSVDTTLSSVCYNVLLLLMLLLRLLMATHPALTSCSICWNCPRILYCVCFPTIITCCQTLCTSTALFSSSVILFFTARRYA